MALMSGFVSCTNEDFEDCLSVADMQKSAMTRSVGGMTKEDVQARLNAIGEKYGAAIMIGDCEDMSSIKNDYFVSVENLLKME